VLRKISAVSHAGGLALLAPTNDHTPNRSIKATHGRGAPQRAPKAPNDRAPGGASRRANAFLEGIRHVVAWQLAAGRSQQFLLKMVQVHTFTQN
jgi:hypothetical protein